MAECPCPYKPFQTIASHSIPQHGKSPIWLWNGIRPPPSLDKKIFTTCHTYIYTIYIKRYINGAKTNIPSPIFISLNGVHLKHLAPYKYKTNTELHPPAAPFEHLFKLSLRFIPNKIQCKLISFLYILKRTNKQWHVHIYEDS